jgi:hypothetical protein
MLALRPLYSVFAADEVVGAELLESMHFEEDETLRQKLRGFLASGIRSKKGYETGFQRFPSQPYVLFKRDTEFS